MVIPTSEEAKNLYKNKKIIFGHHWEMWQSQKKDPKKELKIPGRHVGKDGFIMDKDNKICIFTEMILMHKTIKTSCGEGKRYDTNDHHKLIHLFTDW